MTGKRLEVALGLVFRDGRVLVARRPPGVHLAGLWEFPGGKIQPGETAEACAMREVLEEVGLLVLAERRRPIIAHDYAERSVLLVPVECRYLSGEIELREVVEARWAAPEELPSLEFPAANAELVAELARGGPPSA